MDYPGRRLDQTMRAPWTIRTRAADYGGSVGDDEAARTMAIDHKGGVDEPGTTRYVNSYRRIGIATGSGG